MIRFYNVSAIRAEFLVCRQVSSFTHTHTQKIIPIILVDWIPISILHAIQNRNIRAEGEVLAPKTTPNRYEFIRSDSVFAKSRATWFPFDFNQRKYKKKDYQTIFRNLIEKERKKNSLKKLKEIEFYILFARHLRHQCTHSQCSIECCASTWIQRNLYGVDEHWTVCKYYGCPYAMTHCFPPPSLTIFASFARSLLRPLPHSLTRASIYLISFHLETFFLFDSNCKGVKHIHNEEKGFSKNEYVFFLVLITVIMYSRQH